MSIEAIRESLLLDKDNMAESMSNVCKRAVVPPVCFNKDCKCRIKIPSKAAVVGKDNELTEKDMHENFFNAAMTNKDGNKIDSGAIEKDFEYYDSKQLWFDFKNIGENDIILTQGRNKYYMHPGNIKYRAVIRKNVKYFINAKSYFGRQAVAKHVRNQLMDVMGARFIKYCPALKRWYIMERKNCYTKIRMAMSGMIRYEKNKAVTKALSYVKKKLSQDP